MSDLISRQAALDIVFDFAETPHRMYQQIRELPTIEPKPSHDWNGWENGCGRTYDVQPKKGKWIKDGDAYSLYRCTACNGLCPAVGYADCIPEERMYKMMKYCPNCGAAMKRSEE